MLGMIWFVIKTDKVQTKNTIKKLNKRAQMEENSSKHWKFQKAVFNCCLLLYYMVCIKWCLKISNTMGSMYTKDVHMFITAILIKIIYMHSEYKHLEYIVINKIVNQWVTKIKDIFLLIIKKIPLLNAFFPLFKVKYYILREFQYSNREFSM